MMPAFSHERRKRRRAKSNGSFSFTRIPGITHYFPATKSSSQKEPRLYLPPLIFQIQYTACPVRSEGYVSRLQRAGIRCAGLARSFLPRCVHGEYNGPMQCVSCSGGARPEVDRFVRGAGTDSVQASGARLRLQDLHLAQTCAHKRGKHEDMRVCGYWA